MGLGLVELAAGRLELRCELALDPVATFGQRGLEVGRRLQNGIRAGDLLGRLGGDEFVVSGLCIAPGAEMGNPADAMRQRLQNAVQGHYKLPKTAFDYPGASLGIVVVDPETATPEQALADADSAMYADKKKRRDAKAEAAAAR